MKKPGVVMGLLNQINTAGKGSVGENVRAGNTGAAKQMIASRMAQHWTAKKPNLPEIKKIAEMFKDDDFQFSEEGQKVLDQMRKRFDKAVKMKKASLDGPKDAELFKNFEELAASLSKWNPSK